MRSLFHGRYIKQFRSELLLTPSRLDDILSVFTFINELSTVRNIYSLFVYMKKLFYSKTMHWGCLFLEINKLLGLIFTSWSIKSDDRKFEVFRKLTTNSLFQKTPITNNRFCNQYILCAEMERKKKYVVCKLAYLPLVSAIRNVNSICNLVFFSPSDSKKTYE